MSAVNRNGDKKNEGEGEEESKNKTRDNFHNDISRTKQFLEKLFVLAHRLCVIVGQFLFDRTKERSGVKIIILFSTKV